GVVAQRDSELRVQTDQDVLGMRTRALRKPLGPRAGSAEEHTECNRRENPLHSASECSSNCEHERGSDLDDDTGAIRDDKEGPLRKSEPVWAAALVCVLEKCGPLRGRRAHVPEHSRPLQLRASHNKEEIRA